MTQPQVDRTGVSVLTKIFPMAFLLLFYKTNVEIDGNISVLPWGSHFFALPPGRHDIKIGFQYFLGQNMGQNSATIEVVDGQTISISYRSPFLVFMSGSMKVA